MDDFLCFNKLKCEIYKSQINLYQRGIIERLLQSFSDIEEEAKKEEERSFNSYNSCAGSDSDVGEIVEQIHEQAVQYYLDLSTTRDMLFGFAVVGLYHIWERQIIGFLKREIKHVNAEPKIEHWSQITSNLT